MLHFPSGHNCFPPSKLTPEERRAFRLGRGKHRKTDRTGDIVGPYRVAGYVGKDPLTSLYCILRGIECGHEQTVRTQDINAFKNTKRCFKCKKGTV